MLKDHIRGLAKNPIQQVIVGNEIRMILITLNANGHNVKQAAKDLGMSRAWLNERIRRYGIGLMEENT